MRRPVRGHAIRTTARRLTLFLATLGLTVPLALTTAQPAQAATTVRWSSVRLPLSGSFTGASELIDITGGVSVTVVTRTESTGGGTAQVISSLSGTTGIGRTTGALYRYVGADTDTVTIPPDPVGPLLVFPTFRQINPFVPPNPVVPPNPISPVRITLLLTAAGAIDSIGAEVFSPESGPDS